MAGAQKYVLGGEYDLGNGTLGVWDGEDFLSPDEYVARKVRGRVDMLNNSEKQALSDAQTAAANAISVLSDLSNFQNTMEGRGRKRQAVGGLFGGAANRMAAFFGDPEAQYLDAITSTLAPAKRAPGAGSSSDLDLALFLKGTPGLDKSEAANRALIEDGRREAIRRQQRADFLEAYARENGTLIGAEPAFRAVVGKGTQESPLSAKEAGDRSRIPRGSFYYDPQGNLRRNDNGSAGNPIIWTPSSDPQKEYKDAKLAWNDRWYQRRGNLEGADAAFNQWWASYSGGGQKKAPPIAQPPRASAGGNAPLIQYDSEGRIVR